jgi:Barstar (barnase inhibitor)
MVFLEDLAAPSGRSVRFLGASEEWPSPAGLAGRGLEQLDLDAARVADEAGLFEDLARVFRFPDYFGDNWDAAADCLRDLEWLPARGYVLRVNGAESLWARLPATAGRLVECWLFCAEEWARRGVSFHLVFVWSGE